jgi:hypothetical protein
MSAIISLDKLNQLIGLGLVKEETLDKFSVVFFTSNKENGGVMVNISTGVEGVIAATPTDRCVVGKQTVQQLLEMGILNKDPINRKEIIINKFESKFENQGDLVNFSRPSETALDDLFVEKRVEVAEDGSIDLGEDSF